MRRLLVLGALLGLVAFPAPTMAAEPPDPTISISSVHYAGRGVIELDLRFSCGTPTISHYSWDPSYYVEVDQGRGRNARWAYYEKALGPTSCDGQVHLKVLRLTAEDEMPAFRGGRVTVYAGVYASYENERTEEWVEKSAWIEGVRFHVRRTG